MITTIFLFPAFKEQKLIPAIQSGIVSKVQDVLDYLEMTCMKTHKGKTALGNTGSKRQAQDGDGGKAWTPKQAEQEVSFI
jgi:hypothetical protein